MNPVLNPRDIVWTEEQSKILSTPPYEAYPFPNVGFRIVYPDLFEEIYGVKPEIVLRNYENSIHMDNLICDGSTAERIEEARRFWTDPMERNSTQ